MKFLNYYNLNTYTLILVLKSKTTTVFKLISNRSLENNNLPHSNIFLKKSVNDELYLKYENGHQMWKYDCLYHKSMSRDRQLQPYTDSIYRNIISECLKILLSQSLNKYLSLVLSLDLMINAHAQNTTRWFNFAKRVK